MISLEYDKYIDVQNRLKNFDPKHDAEIEEQIENNLKMMGMNFIECPFVYILASDIEFKDPALRALPTENVQARIETIVQYNMHLLKAIPFVLLDEELVFEDKPGEQVLQTESLAASFVIGKDYALKSIKDNYISTIANTLPTSTETPTIDFNRAEIKQWTDQRNIDYNGEFTYFGKIFQRLKDKNFSQLRIQSSTAQPWYANFINEENDEGTTRRTMASITEELHSDILPLFIPSKNQYNGVGEHQDKWVINPQSASPKHLKMYEFVGALMGMAFRSGNVQDFKLTPLFWKKLMAEPLKLEDLESFDIKAYDMLRQARAHDKMDPDNPISMQKLTYNTTLSDGTIKYFKSDFDDDFVSEKDIPQYIDMVLDARFKEDEKQMAAIVKGFNYVFPTTVMRAIPREEVIGKIIGQEFDLKKIKETSYHSNLASDDVFGTRFWNVIESFTIEERTRYLRCVYGKTRLPPEPKFSDKCHTVSLMYEFDHADHDVVLPTAHPNNFQITLPRYSSEEIMKKQILKLIENTEKYYLHTATNVAEDLNLQKPAELERNLGGRRRSSRFEASAPNTPRPVERRRGEMYVTSSYYTDSDSADIDISDDSLDF